VLGALHARGLLVTIAGGQALRYSPPLVVSERDIAEAESITDAVLTEL
jgi:acetylornithine/succinyldiaminopimelate/putrescine aminotransferase